MKIELISENAAALTQYAALVGHTPAEFLNEYLAKQHGCPCSRTPDQANSKAISAIWNITPGAMPNGWCLDGKTDDRTL